MKKITMDEMEELNESDLYIIEQCSISAKNKDRAEIYIYKLKQLHNELKCFVRYTCTCSRISGATTWYFVYLKTEYENLGIPNKTDTIWNNIFPEKPAGEESGNPYYSIFNEPCVCPFSGE